jgi:peroxiredoxin
MEVLKNLILNWVVPIALLLSVLWLMQLLREPPVQVGDGGQAPAFSLVNTDGESVSLSDYAGKDVIINFWGTWCGPCKAELPGLNRFASRNPEVVVLGIAVDSGGPKVLKRAKEQLKIPFEVLQSKDPVQRAYGVSTLPTTFHVDEQGVLTKSHVGIITPIQLAAWVR